VVALQEYEKFWDLWNTLDDLETALQETIQDLNHANLGLVRIEKLGKDLLK
jgi:hypothetical protein